MGSARRVLVHPDRVAALFRQMRDEMDTMHARHVSELAVVRRELDQVRAAFHELQAVSAARLRAQATVDDLRRRRQAMLDAIAVERDPFAPLN
jgi:hypothetical protein